MLRGAGIEVEGVKRGLDHGVWASFKCGEEAGEPTRLCTRLISDPGLLAFDPAKNPLGVPIVQVSLFDSENPLKHYRLGEAVAALRERNILIIVSGMAVHNLRDLHLTFGSPTPLPYTTSFDEALMEAVTARASEREQRMIELLRRPDAR